MPKYSVYGIMTASKFMGEFEADTKEEAESLANDLGDFCTNICHQCSSEIELSDIYELQTEEVI